MLQFYSMRPTRMIGYLDDCAAGDGSSDGEDAAKLLVAVSDDDKDNGDQDDCVGVDDSDGVGSFVVSDSHCSFVTDSSAQCNIKAEGVVSEGVCRSSDSDDCVEEPVRSGMFRREFSSDVRKSGRVARPFSRQRKRKRRDSGRCVQNVTGGLHGIRKNIIGRDGTRSAQVLRAMEMVTGNSDAKMKAILGLVEKVICSLQEDIVVLHEVVDGLFSGRSDYSSN